MLSINDNVYLSLKIDDKELEFANLASLTITEGNGSMIPALKLELNDPTSALSTDQALTEGNKIELTIARSMKEHVKPRKYRIFGPGQANSSFNPTITIVGILNAPRYVSASSRESFKGTSEEVLNDIASASGLSYKSTIDFNGRPCNDQQTWLNVCKNRASFIQEITRHGWMDKYSGMASCVTSYGELRYMNLIDVINTPASKIQFVFTHSTMKSSNDDSKKSYIVKQAIDRSSGGAMATWVNYGSTRVVNNMAGTPQKVESLDVKTPGSYLAINKDVADEVKRARFDYAPIDCGNTHTKYEDALYQNIKILALFSEKLSLLVDVVTEVELFDPVIYRQADADVTEPVSNTDIYIVVGKSVVIRGGIHYAERLELARMSLTMKGEAKLQTPSGAASERSMIPDVTINKSAIGTVGKDSASALSSISGKINGVNDVSHMLNGAQADVAATLRSTQASVSNYISAVASGTGIASALGGVWDSAKFALNAITKANALYKQANYASTSLTGQLKNMPGSLKQSALSAPNSYMTALSYQASAMVPYGRSVDSLRSVANNVPVKFNSIDSVVGLNNTLNQCDSLMKNSSVNLADQWNNGLSSIRGVPLPGQVAATDTVRQLDTMLQGANTQQSDIEKFVGHELLKDSSRSANWMPRDAFVPTQKFVSVETSLTPVKNMCTRMDAQYKA